MEVRGHDNGQPPHQRFDQLRAEIARRDRARVRQAREGLEGLSVQRREIQRSAREEASQRAEQARDRYTETQNRTAASPLRRDSVEISPVALEAASEAARSSERPAREDLVRELKSQYESGRLNTPERIAESAQRLLGSDG